MCHAKTYTVYAKHNSNIFQNYMDFSLQDGQAFVALKQESARVIQKYIL